jgi:hypothetical protein
MHLKICIELIISSSYQPNFPPKITWEVFPSCGIGNHLLHSSFSLDHKNQASIQIYELELFLSRTSIIFIILYTTSTPVLIKMWFKAQQA